MRYAFSALDHLPRLVHLNQLEHARSSEPLAPLPFRRQRCFRSLDGQPALEVRQSGEQMEYEPPRGAGRVDALGQGPKTDAARDERMNRRNQMRHRTPEPIEARNNQRIAGPERIQTRLQAVAIVHGAGEHVLEDLGAPGGAQGVELRQRSLVGGGNACVPDQARRRASGKRDRDDGRADGLSF